MYATIHRGTHFARTWIGACLMVLVAASLVSGGLQAAPLRYTSSVASGQVFRDADNNRQLADSEQVATTGNDGRFSVPKGKGRIFIRGGTQIPGGGANTVLLTAPPSARGIDTLSSLWQALLHRKQGNAKIKKMLNVPASVTMVNYVAKPIIEKVKPKSKPEKVVKRDSQHRTLVGFLKGLTARGRQGVHGQPLRARPQADGDEPLQDEEIRALADALIARLEGVNKKQWTPTDLADPPTLDTGFKAALSDLGVDPPAPDDLATVVDAAATLNGQIDETDANQSERFTALNKRGELEATLVEQGRYDELNVIAHEFSTAILGIDPDTGDNASDGLTNAAAPDIFGLAEAAAVKIRVHLDETVQDVEVDSLGQWIFTPAANLSEGQHSVTVEGLDGSGTVLPNTDALTLTIDLTPPPNPTAGSLQTSDTTPVLSGNWDPSAGNSLTVTVGGTLYSVGADLVTAGGSWTLTVPNALADGSYPVTVTVTDSAGNAATATATLTVDTAAPAAPTVNAQLATSSTPTVTGTWDSSPGNTLTVSVGGTSYPLGGGALTGSGNAWFLAIPAALADGAYTVTATGSDGAGNVGPSASAILTVDTLPPGAPTVASQLTRDTTPTVTGSWDPTAGNGLIVTLDSQIYSLGSGITTVGNAWSLTASPALADGSYTVAATASDAAGNVASASGTVTVDTTAPPTPTVDVLNFSTTTPTLTGTCGVADTASLTVLLNGKTYNPSCVNDVELGESWLLAIPATDALFDGSFPLGVTATDAVGNSSSAGSLTLTITGTALREAIITTAAGGGVGDGGPATATALWNPQAVAVDGQGNVYLADASLNRVRRIDGSGVITTVAGNGDFLYNGDGGSAAAAALWQPWALLADGNGNLYIADSGQSRVRKVDSAGIITTVAGNGTFAYAGDGGSATAASLGGPSGLALDGAGNLYIADSSFHVVRKVDAATGVITTVAGGGTAGTVDGVAATLATLASPSGLAVDSGGNLFLSDTGHHLVRRVDAANATITTVAGDGAAGFLGDGGPANRARLNFPAGLSFDGIGLLLIADSNNHRIRRVDGNGDITTVAGDGTAPFAGDGGLATAAGVALPNDVVALGSAFYIADTGNNRVRRVDSAGVITTVGGNGETDFGGDGRSATAAMVSTVAGLAVDPANGDVYLTDSGNGRIRMVDASGAITTVAGDGSFNFSGDGGSALTAALGSPQGIALDAASNLYIADNNNQRIRRVDRLTGNIDTVAGNGTSGFAGDGAAATAANLNFPRAVSVFGTAELYIADSSNSRIRMVDLATGIITTVAGGGAPADGIGDGLPATDASVLFPEAVVVDSSGNLYILDPGHSTIRRVDRASGIITTVAGGGSVIPGDGGLATDAVLDFPTDVAVDAGGNLYISEGFSEGGGNRVRVVDAATGIISTLAGNGGVGFGGDGGPAIDATLHNLEAVAVDTAGTVYIGDSGNGRVRRVGAGTVALADSFTLDGVTRSFGTDLGGLAAETSSIGYAAWSSVDAGINVLAGDALDGYAVPNTNASQPDSLATLPYSLAAGVYSVTAEVYPASGGSAVGSLAVGYFMANGAANLPLSQAGTTALALLVDAAGRWQLGGASGGISTPMAVILSGTADATNWSAAAPPRLMLVWDTARRTASASINGVTLFEQVDVAAIDPALVGFVGFGCAGEVAAGALVDDFRFLSLP